METFLTIADRFGVAAAVLVGFGLATWASLKWLARNIASPLVDRHIKFLDAMEKSSDEHGSILKSVAESQRMLVDGQDKIVASNDSVNKKVVELLEKQDTHAGRVVSNHEKMLANEAKVIDNQNLIIKKLDQEGNKKE